MANAWGVSWGTSWADSWGASAVITVPDVRIGAGGNGDSAGLMAYASMRAAEARRRKEEKPIDSLVAPVAPLVVVPPVVEKITRVAPLELHDTAVDKARELKAALEAPKPEPVATPALVYPKTGYAEVPLELVATAPPPPISAMGAAATERATQLAQAQREAFEEEELAMVLLLAA